MSIVISSLKTVLNDYVNREWFLPAIQRPYVWGERAESESFVCKLFDSLYRRYPIGAFIIWSTEMEVAHREFLKDFHYGDIYKNVDSGLFSRKKSLLYDGQQRLQTLFSCLKYSYNNKQLVFNLTYDPSNDSDGLTGFRFISHDQDLASTEIKMNHLFSTENSQENKKQIRREYWNKVAKDDEKSRDLIETNLDKLWDVFVTDNDQPIVYFKISSDKEEEVNEVFARLNTAGVPLSKADLLFSRIKADFPEFESEIMQFSRALLLRRKIAFSSYDILQLIHLIVLGRSRVDDKVTKDQIHQFKDTWDKLREPLNSFFDNYLYANFKITSMRLIRNKNPLLVLAVFFYNYYTRGHKFKNMSKELLRKLNYFFIISEINDWTLQSYTDQFCKLIWNSEDFPLTEIIEHVKYKKNRNVELREDVFAQNCLFALKVLINDREFQYDPDTEGRYNPELDHIFPVHLESEKENENYAKDVDVIWNLQPVKGDINNDKSNFHPKDYFGDALVGKKQLQGSKNLSAYDFLPPLEDPVWNNYLDFIEYRKEQMIKKLQTEYGISLTKPSEV